MKIKIFALVMAICCLSSLFAGCTKAACKTHTDSDINGICDACQATLCEQHTDAEPDGVCDACAANIPVPCAPHKDENADKICDVCNNAIVVLYEQITPEEEKRVDMAVSSIPENVNLQDFVNTTVEQPPKVTMINELDIDEIVDTEENVWAYYSTVIVSDEESYRCYSVYDFEKGKNLLPNVILSTQSNASNKIKTIDIELEKYYFTVTVSFLNVEYGYDYGYENDSISITHYTYAGEEICDFSWSVNSSSQSLMEWYEDVRVESYDLNDVTYVTFDGKIWAFDSETKEILLKEESPLTLVHRPEFDSVCEGKYGYVEKDGKIFVYDLNSWIECVYSYDIPKDYFWNTWFALADGNVLLQGLIHLPSDAVSYDFIQTGSKFDIAYMLLDAAKKSATPVEFGYFISTIESPSEDIFTDKVANVATINPIVDDMLSDEIKIVALNNDLTIEADLTDVLEYQLVNNGVFYKCENLDELAFADYIVDVNGNEVAYVPYDAEIKENYIAYDNKVYSFKMEERFDLSKYEVILEEASFMILYSADEMRGGYYYYSIKENNLSALDYQPTFGIKECYFGYVVGYADETLAKKFAIYNANNQLILDNGDYDVIGTWQIENSYILLTSDGTFYIAN